MMASHKKPFLSKEAFLHAATADVKEKCWHFRVDRIKGIFKKAKRDVKNKKAINLIFVSLSDSCLLVWISKNQSLL